jgi:hypothetical protein
VGPHDLSVETVHGLSAGRSTWAKNSNGTSVFTLEMDCGIWAGTISVLNMTLPEATIYKVGLGEELEHTPPLLGWTKKCLVDATYTASVVPAGAIIERWNAPPVNPGDFNQSIFLSAADPTLDQTVNYVMVYSLNHSGQQFSVPYTVEWGCGDI